MASESFDNLVTVNTNSVRGKIDRNNTIRTQYWVVIY